MSKRIHFIAIGGAAMHNLALALHQKGFQVSGSDDEINEPSKSRLSAAGILPQSIGWFPEKISNELDGVILGMHARADNPELLKAQQIGLPVYSYPFERQNQSSNRRFARQDDNHSNDPACIKVVEQRFRLHGRSKAGRI